jgi:hypothetical protein
MCLAPDISLAQTAGRPEIQEDFRKRVVRSWRWKPKSGIGLTTTKYARDYLLSHYFDSSGQWKGASGGLSREALLNTPLVLFQSRSLDIIVLPLRHASHERVVVVDRQSLEVYLNDRLTCGTYRSSYEFIDVEGDSQLELLRTTDGVCANHMTLQQVYIYGLTEWTQLLGQRAVAVLAGKCPKFINELVEPFPHRMLRDKKGRLTVEFRVSFGLLMKHETGYCALSDPRTVIRRVCEYRAKSERYECTDDTIDAHTLVLSELKTCSNWEDNADNIRWVLENADELRARGFRFPKGFLERLPRHLP